VRARCLPPCAYCAENAVSDRRHASGLGADNGRHVGDGRTAHCGGQFNSHGCASEHHVGHSHRKGLVRYRKPSSPQTVIGANPDPSVCTRRLRFSKMTAPPRRRRCNSAISSRDGVFSAPASPRADPRVFCAAALVAPRLLPRLRFQVLRRALLPQLLRRSRRGTSASFEARCHPLPCIYPPWAPGVS
jgi:hypothetical protein